MDIETYEVGQLVRVAAEFTNAADRTVDPTAVYVEITEPDGAVVTKQYGVDAAVVRDSQGNYHADHSATKIGAHTARWYSTGTGQAARRVRFVVER